MIQGIIANFVGAIFAGLGTVLMRYDARRSDGEGARLVASLIKRPVWLLGAICQLVTAILTFLAFQWAPIPVVQPFAAASLIFVVVFSRPILGEHPGRREILGTVVIVAGLVLALMAVGDRSTLEPIDGIPFVLTLLVLTLYCAGAFLYYVRHEFWNDTAAGVLIGTVTGTTLGIATAMFRVIGVAISPDSGDWVPPAAMMIVAIGVLVVFGGFGFVIFQNALKRHRATAVAPSHQITVLLIPILIAVLAYGQSLPGGSRELFFRIVALVVIVAGMLILSTSPAVAEDLEVAEADLTVEPPAARARARESGKGGDGSSGDRRVRVRDPRRPVSGVGRPPGNPRPQPPAPPGRGHRS